VDLWTHVVVFELVDVIYMCYVLLHVIYIYIYVCVCVNVERKYKTKCGLFAERGRRQRDLC
jgi:hypothetical protein